MRGHGLGEGQELKTHVLTLVSTSSLQGMDPKEQKEIDMKMIDLDGTDNKGKLGACRHTCSCLQPCKELVAHGTYFELKGRHESFPLARCLLHSRSGA